MGFMLDACMAGYRPENIPIAPENRTAPMSETRPILTCHPVMPPTMYAITTLSKKYVI